MRLKLHGHAGLVHFSFEGVTRQLSRDGNVDWVRIENLTIGATYLRGEKIVEFRVLEDRRFHGAYETNESQSVRVSAFCRPEVELNGTNDNHFFEGPAEIGLKACAFQPDLQRGLFVHVFTLAGANGVPVMLDFTVLVPWG